MLSRVCRLKSPTISLRRPLTASDPRFTNSRRIRTSRKQRRNSFRICTYKILRLKVLQNPHLQDLAGEGVKLLTSLLSINRPNLGHPASSKRMKGIRSKEGDHPCQNR